MATMLATSLLLMVYLAGLLVTTTVAQEGICDSSRVGETQRDPNDCGMYFMCMFNRWNHRSCRDGTAFNEETVTCVSPRYVAGCSGSTTRRRSSRYPTRSQCRRDCDHGQCALEENDYVCRCHDGYSGDRCQNPPETEATMTYNQCENRCQRGSCQRQSNGYFTCVCYYGFSGTDCGTSSQGSSTGSGTRANICNPNPCGHGTCRNLGTRYRCDCLDGYRGQTCSIPPVSGMSGRSYSSLLQCRLYCGRRNCVEDGNYYTCRETSQDTGRLDACASRPCANGICYNDNSMRGFSCRCYSGFSGPLCESESVSGTSGRSYRFLRQCRRDCEGGNCERDGNDWRCRQTFQGVAEACRFNGCVNGRCQASGNSYRCVCNPNYSGRYCDQRTGFGSERCNPNPCFNNGRCQLVGAESFQCFCPEGYAGGQCRDIDHCFPNPCGNGESCRLTTYRTDYECTRGSGSFSNRCNPNPCFNSGRCQLVGANDFECFCAEGYAGRQCRDIDYCFPNPCGNGERCQLTTDGRDYECIRGEA